MIGRMQASTPTDEIPRDLPVAKRTLSFIGLLNRYSRSLGGFLRSALCASGLFHDSGQSTFAPHRWRGLGAVGATGGRTAVAERAGAGASGTMPAKLGSAHRISRLLGALARYPST